ncbi:carboxypeptidase-like regulatory domain-containing protein [Solitalea sp. MAHUQ-68]|uniref:Carboxypeptidase-like regulatory domain-containing protein n=1 Tax=Solitalea agri TaxID=2953739 RepID=A0A9X2F5J0_9SPHI|nr:carboxypeptidase-like regulatory domain-containing protein [Solitalea agri]MCO4292741.1 carboxypeptidase-like regulatory domain-containing protein [Solitalea agri]
MTKQLNYLLILILAVLGAKATYAQDAPKQQQVIQFSGTIYASDSINEKIPFVNIRVKNSRRGTVSDINGFFSIPIYKTDTLIFSALGYGNFEFYLQDEVPNNRIYLNIRMRPQIYTLKGVTVYGLTKENFKRAFLELEIPENAYAYKVNAKNIPTPEELRLPPPVGIVISPSELLKEIPFIKNASDKKKHKKRVEKVEKDGDEIPEMH